MKERQINLESVKDRLLDFIEKEHESVCAFERKCGFSKGYIGKSTGNYSLEFLMRMKENYPGLDIPWLILGDSTTTLIDSPSVEGSGNTIQAGDHNSYNAGETINKLVDELTAQRIAKDTQIDRLLSLLEKR